MVSAKYIEICVFFLLLSCIDILEFCQIQTENCACYESKLTNEIEMNCLEVFLDNPIDLDLDFLYLNNNNTKSIRLIIKNKFINQIKTSLTNGNGYLKMITSLRIENSKIVELKSDSFIGLIALNELFINKNQLEVIQRNAFNGLDLNLKKLEMISNGIRLIDKNMFNTLVYLEYLNMGSNLIEEIKINSFHGLINLKTLILNSNKLRKIPNDLFQNLTNLEKLF